MAGTPEMPEKGIPDRVRDIMVRFNLEEKEAILLLQCSSLLAIETFEKWRSNLRKIQTEKITEILKLIKKARKGNLEALVEAESKLQAIM